LAGDLTDAYGPAASTIHDRLGALLQSVGRNRSQWGQVRDSFGQLQARFDQEAEDFVAEASPGPDAGSKEAGRRATLFMRHALELFEETVRGLLQKRQRRIAAIETPSPIYP
jgi:YD repeat-containing protein